MDIYVTIINLQYSQHCYLSLITGLVGLWRWYVLTSTISTLTACIDEKKYIDQNLKYPCLNTQGMKYMDMNKCNTIIINVGKFWFKILNFFIKGLSVNTVLKGGNKQIELQILKLLSASWPVLLASWPMVEEGWL